MIGALSQLGSVVILTTAVAVLLTLFGFRQGLLQMRPDGRRCPSCGRRLRSWTCWSCTDSRDT